MRGTIARVGDYLTSCLVHTNAFSKTSVFNVSKTEKRPASKLGTESQGCVCIPRLFSDLLFIFCIVSYDVSVSIIAVNSKTIDLRF